MLYQIFKWILNYISWNTIRRYFNLKQWIIILYYNFFVFTKSPYTSVTFTVAQLVTYCCNHSCYSSDSTLEGPQHNYFPVHERTTSFRAFRLTVYSKLTRSIKGKQYYHLLKNQDDSHICRQTTLMAGK